MSDEVPLRLLVVEDDPLDHELLLRQLARDGMRPQSRRVETESELREALAASHWDAVISDHNLPRFSSDGALRVVRESGLNLPFLIVSGTIGEDAAVAAMRAGADDFLIKGRLARLAPALRNAIAAADERRRGRQTQLALEESERRLHELAGHLQQAIEDERAAIAREIHDDIGGMLTALRFDLSWLDRHAGAQTQPRVRQAIDTLNQAVLATQRVMRNLRPPALDAGLVAALEFLVEQFGKRSGLRTTLACNRERVELPEPLAITVYRVAQESLTNVLKHANGATHVRVDLVVQTDVLSLEIVDDGAGLAEADLRKPTSYGLRGLDERARLVGGWLDVSSAGGQTVVLLTLPLNGAPADGASGLAAAAEPTR